MKLIRILILFGTLGVFLYLINSGIISAEKSIENEPKVYLELAPVDPQSLIQGFYMDLSYQIERDATAAGLAEIHKGQLVISLGDDAIAHFERLYEEGESLAPNEKVINFYSQGGWNVRIGAESFLFQEGHAGDYARAQYAEVRVLPDGSVMLVNLADENLETIIPE